MSRYGAKDCKLEPNGIEPGKAPGLAGGVERIGRRADAEMAGDRNLLVPGVEAVGLHADRDVEIEPDLHAELLRQIGGGPQLPVGGPLHEFDELDFVGVRALAQGSASGIVRLPPLFRPFPPRLAEFVPEHLEAGKVRQQGAALGAEFVKILLAGRLGVGLESSKGRAQRPPLQAGDADVIDDIACPQRRQRLACFGIGLKFGKLFDVDIERVEKQPAVRRIRAAVARAVVEQGVQRIEADAVGAEMIGEFDQAGEVGEVTHAPVARGADAVKLDREQPATVELAAKRPFRRRNQRHILGGRSIAHLKPVDARRQVRGPVDGVIRALAFGDNA